MATGLVNFSITVPAQMLCPIQEGHFLLPRLKKWLAGNIFIFRIIGWKQTPILNELNWMLEWTNGVFTFMVHSNPKSATSHEFYGEVGVNSGTRTENSSEWVFPECKN